MCLRGSEPLCLCARSVPFSGCRPQSAWATSRWVEILNPSRRIVALVVALLLPAASFILVAAFVERPLVLSSTRTPHAPRAAIAIRDDVIAFQKWGTRSFTLPALERGYDRVWYFTESEGSSARAAFVAAVAEACAEYQTVDLYLLAHANRYVDAVAALGPERTAPLRLVYNTGCGDADQSTRWLSVGADAYVGHVGVSQSPVFFVYFLRRWVAGAPLGESVVAANDETRRVLRVVGRVAFGAADTEVMIADSTAVRAGGASLTIGGAIE